MKTQKENGIAVDGKATPETVAKIVSIDPQSPEAIFSAKMEKINEVAKLMRWHSRLEAELTQLKTELNSPEIEKLKVAVGGDYRESWKSDNTTLVKEVVSFIISRYEAKIAEVKTQITEATI